MESLFNNFSSLLRMDNLCDTKMVILVRTDIGMGKGKVATQCAQAAVSLCQSAREIYKSELKSWVYAGQPKMILKVNENCEEIMNTLYTKAKEKGLNVCMVYDSSRVDIKESTLTVVGIGPNCMKDIENVTKDFKLL